MARLLGAVAAEHSPSPGDGSQIPNPHRKMGNRTEIPAPTSTKYPYRPRGHRISPTPIQHLGLGKEDRQGTLLTRGLVQISA